MVDQRQIINVVQQGLNSVGLLFATLIFVKAVFEEYQEGSTYFSISEQPLTNRDLPTATICILAEKKMKYQSEFDIQTSILILGKLPKKLTLKSKNALFFMALHQVVLQDINKAFQYVHLGVKMY